MSRLRKPSTAREVAPLVADRVHPPDGADPARTPRIGAAALAGVPRDAARPDTEARTREAGSRTEEGMKEGTIDTANRFMVGVFRDDLVFLRPVPQKLSKDDALNLAAWIVALADDSGGDDDGDFQALLKAIRNT
jgi:hypothetical protein